MTGRSEPALRKTLWAGLALVMLGVSGAGALSLLRDRPAGAGAARPPVYGRVPDFSLVERSGRRVEAAEFRGIVWVVDFIYTRCTDTCPLQSAQMAALQMEYAAEPDFRLVSITVDPAWDRPEVLARYARRFGGDPERWLFLTGKKGAIMALAQEGFRLPVAEPAAGRPSPLDRAFPPEGPAAPPAPPSGGKESRAWGTFLAARPALAHEGGFAPPIIHSARFALVDRQGRIRGYYDSGDPEALGRLRRDARVLLQEARR